MEFADQCLAQASSETLLLGVDEDKHRDPQPDKLDYEALSPRLIILYPKQCCHTIKQNKQTKQKPDNYESRKCIERTLLSSLLFWVF